jgi:predicted amidohydrolase
VLVCWDQWYPEAARLTAMQGADVLFYPTAIGWHPYEKAEHGAAQLAAWQTIQRSHAIANGIYVAAVNRIGFEGEPGDDLEFWGHSFVSDPFGVVVAEASQDREETLVWSATRHTRKRSGATGRSSATAAWMPSGPSRRAGWAEKQTAEHRPPAQNREWKERSLAQDGS